MRATTLPPTSSNAVERRRMSSNAVECRRMSSNVDARVDRRWPR
jgi:hypothetical protein